MYVTSKTLADMALGDSIPAAFLLAALIGLGLGLFNALFISFFRLPTLIVTLGTAGMFRGFMLAFIGTSIVNTLPSGTAGRFSKWTVFSYMGPSGETAGLSASPLVVAAIAAAAWLGLRYTMLGRGIYAMGGNPEAAERCGFNLTRLRCLIYGLSGCLAGVAGVIHAATLRNANPFDLVGHGTDRHRGRRVGRRQHHGRPRHSHRHGAWRVAYCHNEQQPDPSGDPAHFQRVAVGVIIVASTALSTRCHAQYERGFEWR